MLSAPIAVTFTPNDVRSLPRSTGSADVDVAEVLSQFPLVFGFRVKAIAPHDEKFSDIILSLSTCPVLAMVLVLRYINN